MSSVAALHHDQMLEHRPDVWSEGVWPQSKLLWMVGFWMMLYVIRPWERLFPELGPLHVERLYCSSVLIVVVSSGAFQFNLSRQTMAGFGLLGAMIMSAVMGAEPSRGTVQIYKLLVHLAMYFVVISSVRTPRDLVFIALIYLISMGLYLGKAEWEYFVHNRHSYSMGVRRLIGIDFTYRHPNGVGASTVLTLPFWYFLWKYRHRICAPHVPYARWLLRGIQLYPLLAISAVLLTNSRGAMIGCVAFAVLTAIGWNVSGKMIGRLLVVSIVATSFFVMIMPDVQRERLTTLWNPESGPDSAHNSADGRIAGAKAGWQMFLRFPITGAGTGHWKMYRPGIDGSHQVAHNLYGQMLGEFGLVGGCALAFFCGSIYVNFRRVGAMARRGGSEELNLVSEFALASRNSFLLLLYFGLGSSNLSRFNWYWLAALGVATYAIAQAAVAAIEAEEELA